MVTSKAVCWESCIWKCNKFSSDSSWVKCATLGCSYSVFRSGLNNLYFCLFSSKIIIVTLPQKPNMKPILGKLLLVWLTPTSLFEPCMVKAGILHAALLQPFSRLPLQGVIHRETAHGSQKACDVAWRPGIWGCWFWAAGMVKKGHCQMRSSIST